MKEILTRIKEGRGKRVKKHNNLVQSSQRKELSVLAQKLLLFTFTSKYNKEGANIINYREFLTSVGGKSRQLVDIACHQLSSQTIWIDNSTEEEIDKKYIPIFEEIHLKGSKIEYTFNRRIIDLVNPTSNYLSFDYSNVINLRKDHSPRLYELLRNGVDKYPTRVFTCLEIIEKLGLDKKNYLNKKGNGYSFAPLTEMLKDKIKHINDLTDINVTLTTNKKRNYTSYIFYRESKKKTEPSSNLLFADILEAYSQYMSLFEKNGGTSMTNQLNSYYAKVFEEVKSKFGEKHIEVRTKNVIVEYFNGLSKSIPEEQMRVMFLESMMINYINNDIRSPLENYKDDKLQKLEQSIVDQLLSSTISTPEVVDDEIESEQQPMQASLDFGASSQMHNSDFEVKLEKLKVRLGEIGIPKTTIKLAAQKYMDNPKWKIWPEINNVKMAMKDGEKFPNKYTLRKFIEESEG